MKFFMRNQGPPLAKWNQFAQGPQGQYMGFSRAYQTHATVFACIEMLATSVGEPMMVGRKWQRNSPTVRNQLRVAQAGAPYKAVNKMAIENGFYKDITDHPLIRLLQEPNPWMSSDDLWGNVILDRAIAGNAYLLKARYVNGLLKGKPAELWRLRPDRVKIIPGAGFIEAFEYNTGTDKVRYAPEDVLHFKTRNPMDDFYGQPTLLALSADIDIGMSMKMFLKTFFERGGAQGPGSILSVKQKVSQENKDEIRERFRSRFGQVPGELLILDQAESTFQQMGLNRGLRDALPKEISDSIDAAIAMEFGIPASILGIPIGMESSSYANKRSDWQVLWDMTMAPLLSSLEGEITRKLVPDFGGIDEVVFDVSDIKALQEDVDLIHKRHRDNFLAGMEFWEDAREGIGLDPNAEGTLVIPPGYQPIFVRAGKIELPEPVAPEPKQIEAPVNIVAEVHCPKCGRWVGRNMNVGAVAYCPKDKEVPVVLPGESKVISIDVVRDDDGKVMQLVGASE